MTSTANKNKIKCSELSLSVYEEKPCSELHIRIQKYHNSNFGATCFKLSTNAKDGMCKRIEQTQLANEIHTHTHLHICNYARKLSINWQTNRILLKRINKTNQL